MGGLFYLLKIKSTPSNMQSAIEKHIDVIDAIIMMLKTHIPC